MTNTMSKLIFVFKGLNLAKDKCINAILIVIIEQKKEKKGWECNQ